MLDSLDSNDPKNDETKRKMMELLQRDMRMTNSPGGQRKQKLLASPETVHHVFKQIKSTAIPQIKP